MSPRTLPADSRGLSLLERAQLQALAEGRSIHIGEQEGRDALSSRKTRAQR